jgi:hypothetical protein
VVHFDKDSPAAFSARENAVEPGCSSPPVAPAIEGVERRTSPPPQNFAAHDGEPSYAYRTKHFACPSCNSRTLVLMSGMLICPSCGYEEGCCD